MPMSTHLLRLSCLIVFSLAVIAMTGCGPKKKALVYDTGPAMPAGEIDAQLDSMSETGYTIVQSEPTVGRFPCAIAVARLTPPGPVRITDDGDRTRWRVETIKEEEATHWNALFTRMAPIREVIVLDAAALTWPEATHDEINTVARNLNATLCLLYGPSRSTPYDSAYSGVILDTGTGRPVACIRAQASPENYEPPHRDRFKEDLRHRDPQYLAARRFELQARRCVADLITRDRPPATTQPSLWRDRALENRERSLIVVPNRDLRW